MNYVNYMAFLLLILLNYIIIASGVYDRSHLTYSPTGRLLQVEEAIEAVNNGDPVVALKCSDGLIIMNAREKLPTANIGRRLRSRSKKLIFPNSNTCVAITGLLFDSLMVNNFSKKIAANHRRIFGEQIPLETLADELADQFHKGTISGLSRPIVLGLVVCGYDQYKGYQIYTVMPNGGCESWIGTSLGQKSNKFNECLVDILKTKLTDSGIETRNLFPPISESIEIIKSKIVKEILLHDKNSLSADGVIDRSEWEIELLCGRVSDEGIITWTNSTIDST